MNDKEYHSHEALSQSKLKVLAESPRQFYRDYILKLKIEDDNTTSKQLGTCWDLALTDPKLYTQLIVQYKGGKPCKTTTKENGITLAWKAQIDEGITSLNSYKMELPEFAKANSYLTLESIFAKCTKQEQVFWNDPHTGEECRGKLDFSFYANGIAFIIDLKSTKAATFDEFFRDFIKYKYYLQAAMYCTGYRLKHKLNYYPAFYFVAISTVTGEVFTVKVSDQMLTHALIEMDGLIALYRYYKTTNEWAQNKPPVIIDLPDWKINQILNTYSIGVAA